MRHQTCYKFLITEDELLVIGEALFAFPDEDVEAIDNNRGEEGGLTLDPFAAVIDGLREKVNDMLDKSFVVDEHRKKGLLV